MQTVSSLFEHELGKLIDEAIERVKTNAISHVHPHDHYAKYVGQAEALNIVKNEMFSQARELADQSNR